MVGLFFIVGLLALMAILIRFFKWGPKMVLTLFTGMIIIAGLGLYLGIQPPKVVNHANYLEIQGLYGVKIDYEDILGITLSNNIPQISMKANGLRLGNILRGNFRLKGIGAAKLYVNQNIVPFICIATKRNYIILNFGENRKTVKTFTSIREAWKKQIKN